ncbi:MAG: hypothetical protein HGB12_05375 [Bacteroidetes bacterium]|nr:hypothetical protein [Bacteroidota bacterium]
MIEYARIDLDNGYIGIGITTPSEQLQITKNFRLPATTGSTVGVIRSDTSRYIHNYGTDNFFAGVNAGNFTMSGDGRNVGVGVNALKANTTGIGNTASGFNTLQANTTGSGNIANGYYSLYANTTGGYNIAIGSGALINNISGSGNTAIGAGALENYYEQSYNTALGYNAGDNDGACTYSTFIGVHANAYDSYVLTNATAIGYGAIVDASNKVVIGNTSVGWIGGQVSWSTLSDSRFKFNVTEDVKGLEFIKKLRPVTYQMDTKKADDFLIKNMPDSIKLKHQQGMDFTPSTAIVRSGFIAQEVELAANEIGYKSSIVSKPDDAEKNTYSLRYAELVVPLVKAVQELSKNFDDLKINQEQKNNSHAVGLPEYPDNAAAISAGLAVGDFYRTGDLLKVVH